MAKEKHIEKFGEDVRSLLGERVDRILLYGSYARGEETPGSDIDIAVIV
ncbi:MAG: nucleotidyltransferase family protein [Candidatus Aenigmatarchaeota archaeon]